MNRFERRIEQVRASMEAHRIDAMLLTPSGDMEYITGLRRQRPNATESHMFGDYLYGVLITPTRTLIFAPHLASHFIAEQLKSRPWLGDIVALPGAVDLPEEGFRLFAQLGLANGTIALPKHGLAMTAINLQQRFPSMRFANTEPLINPLRMIKEPEDLAIMQQAAAITDNVYRDIVAWIRPGMSEAEVTHQIDWLMLKHGAEGTSFTTAVICRGPNNYTGLENSVNRITGQTLRHGSAVAFDFGVVYEGWVSDFGRTIYIGEPNKVMQETHRLVMQAQQEAIKVMIGGTRTTAQVDAAARDYLAANGYREEFFHRLGHGIGMDVHERPFLSELDTALIENGMTFTVEPSLWIKEHHFVRVEDVVVVTPEGGKSLNNVPAFELTVID